MRRLPLGPRHRPLSVSEMMNVTVRLYANLPQHVRKSILNEQSNGIRAGDPIEIALPSGSTLGDLVATLSLPEDLVKITFVNGVVRNLDHQLQPGDQVGMFPPIAGG